MTEPKEPQKRRGPISLAESVGRMSEDEILDEMTVVAERTNHVRFGWLQDGLFSRYVPSQITAD